MRDGAALGWGTGFWISQVSKTGRPGAPGFVGCWRKTKAKAGYAQGFRLAIPPMRDGAAHGWGTRFCTGFWISQVSKIGRPGAPGLWVGWRKTKAKAKAGPSLRLKNAYGQDDGYAQGFRLAIPPMRDGAAHGWGTGFCTGFWISQVSKTGRPGAPGFVLVVALMCSSLMMAQGDVRPNTGALEQQGQNAEAAAEWRAYSVKHPSEAEPYAHIGQLEARQGNFAAAIAAYKKGMAIAPAMPGLRPNLGLAYFKNGDYKQAIEIFAPMLKANPNDQRVTLLVGMSHYGLGEYAAANPYLKRAGDGDTQNLELQLTLAHSCLFAHEYQCVLDAFHRIVALNAESAEADMLMGEALDEMHDPLGAQKEFRAAVAADPKQPDVHFGLGYLLWTKAQYPEAAEQFAAELANNPQHTQAMLYLADTQMKTGKTDEAQASLEKLVKMTPQNAMAHRDLGTLYADAGQNDAGVAELKKAIELAPKDAAAHWRLAKLYRAMGRAADAKVEFDKTNSLNKAEDERLVKVMGGPQMQTPAAPKQ